MSVNEQSWRNREFIERYFSGIHISTEEVHYAYNYPGESTLQLLGDVGDKRTLEIGCGAGQNSIALSKQGASAVALDLSEQMLAKARENARLNKVSIDFIHGPATSISAPGLFDIAISCYVLDYIEDIDAV